MTETYNALLAIGQAYERYIVSRLRGEGVVIDGIEGKQAQLVSGDTTLGIEIKLDRLFHKTGNLYFEIAEKTRASNQSFVKSGIYRADKCRWYGIGDYRDWFLFKKSDLVSLAESKAYRMVETATSRGFAIPFRDAKALVLRDRHWTDREVDGTLAMLTADEIHW